LHEAQLSRVLSKAAKFVTEGCRAIIGSDPPAPERFLISPCPVSTAFAVMALLTKPGPYANPIKSGIQYLKASRNPDGGWGRTPASPSDEKSTQICRTALNCLHTGVTPQAVRLVAANIGAAWLQDVPRLVFDWPSDSPLIKMIEFFIFSEAAGNVFADISFDYLPVILLFLPPGGRPFIMALSCILATNRPNYRRSLPFLINRLAAYQSPNGAWCEDILITSLCTLCLSITGRNPAARARGLRWLASVQYPSGAWPSFNQLTNWDVGLTAFVAGSSLTGQSELIKKCARFLSARANRDGSYGTVSPYAFPDTDDTSVALLGLVAALPYTGDSGLAGRISTLLLSLQNKDGSWGTFPEVAGAPPDCTSHHPVHIKSVDVTVHVLQSLLQSGLDINSPGLQKSLWWLAYQQKWDGSWKSTWYVGNTYATAQVLELLAEYDTWPRSRLKARNWLVAAQQNNGGWPTGSAGECGLALSALLKNGEAPLSTPVQKGLAYISSLQQADGSFKPAYGGLYASGLYYEDPITEALAVIRAIRAYQTATSSAV